MTIDDADQVSDYDSDGSIEASTDSAPAAKDADESKPKKDKKNKNKKAEKDPAISADFSFSMHSLDSVAALKSQRDSVLWQKGARPVWDFDAMKDMMSKGGRGTVCTKIKHACLTQW